MKELQGRGEIVMEVSPVWINYLYETLLRMILCCVRFLSPPCVWNYYQFMQIWVRRTYTLVVRTRDTCVWKAFAYVLNRRGACISYLASKVAASGGFASSAAAPPPPQKQNPRLRVCNIIHSIQFSKSYFSNSHLTLAKLLYNFF